MIPFAHGHYQLESLPPDRRIPAGGFTLSGWIVAAGGTPFVDARIRERGRTTPAVYGLPRRDLAAAFGSRRPFLAAGVEIELRLPPGPAGIELQVRALDGAWLPVVSVQLEAVGAKNNDGSTPPAVPPLRPHEFSRALLRLLRHAHGISPADLDQAAAGIAARTPWPPVLRHPHRPFHGFLDEPAALSRSSFGRVQVAGWLFHETRSLSRVIGSFDLSAFEPLTRSGESPAIAARFPQFESAAKSAVSGVLDAPAQLAGPASLRVFAELEDGSWHLCHAQRTDLFDQEDEKQRFIASDAATFLRAIRSLRAAFAAAAVPVETGIPWLRELAECWRAYAARRSPPRPAAALGPALRPSARTSAASAHSIVLVTQSLALEGAPLFLVEYAERLHAEGMRLTVVAGADGPLRARFQRIQARIEIVDVSELRRARTRRELQAVIRGLSQRAPWSAGDVVVVNTLSCFWAIPAARAAGRRTLFYLHESTTPARFLLGQFAPAAIPLLEGAVAAADRVSFLTETTRRYYAGLGDANHRVTPGWIDLDTLDAYRRGSDRGAVRARLGVPEDRRVVVNVGTACDRKAQTLFIRMVDRLWQAAPELARDAEFVIVGGRQTPYDAAMQALARDVDHPNLRIAPETSGVFDWYAAADLFVCTSFEESFPRVILEAMAFELPIASTAVHGIPEMARAGREAVHFPAGDTAAGADAMRQLLIDRPFAERLGRAARERVSSHFTLDEIFPRHRALLQELLVTR